MQIKFIKILMIFLFSFFFGCGTKVKSLAVNGILDLSEWDFDRDGVVYLDGEWKFYWKQLHITDPQSINLQEEKILVVPGLWNGIPETNKNKAFGFGTYKLLVKIKKSANTLGIALSDAGTSYKLYLNKEKLLENGNVGSNEKTSAPQFLPKKNFFKTDNDTLEIVIEVSNFSHYKGGLWESVIIGTNSQIEKMKENQSNTELFLIGSILIMATYHFGLYSLRKKDKSSLYFGIFCLTVLFRLITTGNRFLMQQFPTISWELANKIEYISMYTAPIFFYIFVETTFPNTFSKIFKYITIGFQGTLSLIVLFTFSYIYAHTFTIFPIFFIIFIIVNFFYFWKAIYRGEEGAIIAAFGAFIMVFSSLNDILHTEMVINTGYYFPYGLFGFIFAQSYMLSLKFSKAFFSVEKLSEELEKTNNAYIRFVPTEFLNLLEKRSIIDINLGDQILKEMTILFSDIRSFTEISEYMTPKENFDFLNSYLESMNPIIVKNKGFIDKYIGDAVMALYPNTADDAVRSAIEMQEEIRRQNHFRLKKDILPLKVGIGIHTGVLMLGTIGSAERMEGTVISDAVNLASRIEGLTKVFNSGILISEKTFIKLSNPSQYKYRVLGKVKVKGKNNIITVYEIYSGLAKYNIELLDSTKDIFKDAFHFYQNKDFEKSKELFEIVVEKNPIDFAAKLYLERVNSYIQDGPPRDREGYEKFSF